MGVSEQVGSFRPWSVSPPRSRTARQREFSRPSPGRLTHESNGRGHPLLLIRLERSVTQLEEPMRLPPVLVISLALSACVSSADQRRAAPLPPANVGDTRATAGVPPPSITPAPANAKRITYNGAGGYILPDGTTVAEDGSGGFRLPNGAYVAPDGTGSVTLPNGTRCTSDGARGYLCP